MPAPRLALRPLGSAVRSFLATESGGAALLLAATAAALVWANLGGSYEDVWNTAAGVHVGEWSFAMSLRDWVDDVAMVVFFLVIGLEINREVTAGELRSRRSVAVPALGALGGLAIPALIYLAFNAAGPAAGGWGIVMSTDTAFLIGILALFGPRCPDQLRLFLLTLAVVDDIGAIVVLAVAYSDGLHLGGLALAAAFLATILAMRWLGVRRVAAYVVVGVGLWAAILASGVHPTLAGVLLGLTIPVAVSERAADRATHSDKSPVDHPITSPAGFRGPTPEPPGQALQRRLHPWSAFAVVPLFGLANAGVRLDAETLREAATSPVSIGIVVALVVGNAIGVFGASAVALRLGAGDLPGRVRYSHLLGGAMLAGIGFTISLLITQLALDEADLIAQAKIGILAGSLIAAVVGSVTLRAFGERWPLCSPAALPDRLPAGPWR